MGKDYRLSLKAISLKNEPEVDCIQAHRPGLAIQEAQQHWYWYWDWQTRLQRLD